MVVQKSKTGAKYGIIKNFQLKNIRIDLKTEEDEGDIKREREKVVLGEGNDLFVEDVSSCMSLKGQCGCIQKTASLVFQEAAVTLNMTFPK